MHVHLSFSGYCIHAYTVKPFIHCDYEIDVQAPLVGACFYYQVPAIRGKT